MCIHKDSYVQVLSKNISYLRTIIHHDGQALQLSICFIAFAISDVAAQICSKCTTLTANNQSVC